MAKRRTTRGAARKERAPKAKSKKKINEGDLSTIFLKAQSKKMPILLLINADLSKQAQELLEAELHGLTVKKF